MQIILIYTKEKKVIEINEGDITQGIVKNIKPVAINCFNKSSNQTIKLLQKRDMN